METTPKSLEIISQVNEIIRNNYPIHVQESNIIRLRKYQGELSYSNYIQYMPMLYRLSQVNIQIKRERKIYCNIQGEGTTIQYEQQRKEYPIVP